MLALFTSLEWWIPTGIFLAEMCVVTLGTMRIIFVSQGRRYLAPCLGFFEIVIWLFAITQIMKNLSDLSCFFAFALGFSVGNYLGILLEKKLAMGKVNVRIITNCEAADVVTRLRSANYGVTEMQGMGARGQVNVLMTIIPRDQLPQVVTLVKTCLPSAFYTVDDVQEAGSGIFPVPRPRVLGLLPSGVKLLAWVGSMLSAVVGPLAHAMPLAPEHVAPRSETRSTIVNRLEEK